MLAADDGQKLLGRQSSCLPERQALPEMAHAWSAALDESPPVEDRLASPPRNIRTHRDQRGVECRQIKGDARRQRGRPGTPAGAGPARANPALDPPRHSSGLAGFGITDVHAEQPRARRGGLLRTEALPSGPPAGA